MSTKSIAYESFGTLGSGSSTRGIAASMLRCFVRTRLLADVQEVIANLVAGHRELVHPHAEVRDEMLPINEHTATAVQANLCVLLDGLARRIEGGWLKRYRGG